MTSNALAHVDCYKGPWNRAVDVGAHKGEFSHYAVQKGAEVFAIESNPAVCSVISEHVNGIPHQVKILNLAVVPDARLQWHAVNMRVLQGNGNTQVEAISFANLLRLTTPVDFLKIDIEGMEWSLFDNGILPLLENVRFMALEIHPPPDGRTYEQGIADMLDFLANAGFTDGPCKQRLEHPGDFCSYNHFLKGA